MIPVSHVILHLGLCSPVAKLAPETTIAIRVRATDKRSTVVLDRVFRSERGDEDQSVVEFDVPWGIYRLDASVPKSNCNATDYVQLLPDHIRSISETLVEGPAPPVTPMLLSGTAPQSFLYVKPTFVLFDKAAVTCNKPVPDPLPSHIVVENDQDAYYAWMYLNSPPTPGVVPMLALRLKTPTHQYHYVRLPMPVPAGWGGWPASVQFTVNEDMIDELASDPVDTLLCPKLWETTAG
jgi:hypothetical protein